MAEVAELLKWAEGLARARTVLKTPVRYLETPLRFVTVTAVGRTAHGCLAAVTMARHWEAADSELSADDRWHPVEYWRRMEVDALHELETMRDAVFAQAAGKAEPAVERPTAMQMRLGEEPQQGDSTWTNRS